MKKNKRAQVKPQSKPVVKNMFVKYKENGGLSIILPNSTDEEIEYLQEQFKIWNELNGNHFCMEKVY